MEAVEEMTRTRRPVQISKVHSHNSIPVDNVARGKQAIFSAIVEKFWKVQIICILHTLGWSQAESCLFNFYYEDTSLVIFVLLIMSQDWREIISVRIL